MNRSMIIFGAIPVLALAGTAAVPVLAQGPKPVPTPTPFCKQVESCRPTAALEKKIADLEKEINGPRKACAFIFTPNPLVRTDPPDLPVPGMLVPVSKQWQLKDCQKLGQRLNLTDWQVPARGMTITGFLPVCIDSSPGELLIPTRGFTWLRLDVSFDAWPGSLEAAAALPFGDKNKCDWKVN